MLTGRQRLRVVLAIEGHIREHMVDEGASPDDPQVAEKLVVANLAPRSAAVLDRGSTRVGHNFANATHSRTMEVMRNSFYRSSGYPVV